MMGSRRPQKEHIRTLLKDAIMSVCHKGLDHSPTFSVEALIGITLDGGDVLLLSINETTDSSDDFKTAQLGAALGQVLPSPTCDRYDEDATTIWPSKRRLCSKGRPSNTKRRRGRPRKLVTGNTVARLRKDSSPPDHAEDQPYYLEDSLPTEEDSPEGIEVKTSQMEDRTQSDCDSEKTDGDLEEHEHGSSETQTENSQIALVQEPPKETSPDQDVPTEEQSEDCVSPNSAMPVIDKSPTVTKSGVKKKRGHYRIVSISQQFEMAKYAVTHGNCSAARHFSNKLGHKINESTIRNYVSKYRKRQTEKQNYTKNSEHLTVKQEPVFSGEDSDVQETEAGVTMGADSDIPQVGPYQCSMCSAVYKYRKCLIEHQLKLHQPREEEDVVQTFPCDKCDKVFPSKRSLTRHVVVHSAHRERYPCEVCHKTFTCQRHVDFHIQTVHEGMYPYMCDLCGKQVTTKSSLAGHMASKHSMDRIKCSKCDREYSSHATFIRHVCAEKPKKMEETVCSVCEKSFDHPKRLVQHMSKHLEPRLQCETCGRSFKWVSSLQAHKLAAHKMEDDKSGQQSTMIEQTPECPTAVPTDMTEPSTETHKDPSTDGPMGSSHQSMDLSVESLPGPSFSPTEGSRVFYTLPYGGVQQISHTAPPTVTDIAPPEGWVGEQSTFFVSIPNSHGTTSSSIGP